MAVAALKPEGGWFHVHENVAHGEFDSFGAEMVAEFIKLFREVGRDVAIEIKHVESVKQYSPRVDHLVYDLEVVPCCVEAAAAEDEAGEIFFSASHSLLSD